MKGVGTIGERLEANQVIDFELLRTVWQRVGNTISAQIGW